MLAARLAALGSDLARDNRFRLAVLQSQPAARSYLLDYAGHAMHLSGLSLLQVQDSAGRILSSGHFRNEFDQLQPELPRLLAATPGAMTLVRTRTAEAPLLALARVDSFRVAGRRFSLVGGIGAEDRLFGRLAEGHDLRITLVYPGAEPVESPGARVVRTVYTGPYERLGEAWGEFISRLEAAGYRPAAQLWERYLTDPAATPDPADYQTELNRTLI